MKKLRLLLTGLAVSFGLAAVAQPYQIGLATITPAGANGESPITITITPANICTPDGKQNVGTAPEIRMHSGLMSGGVWGTKTHNFDAGAETTLIPNGDGTFSITLTPRDWFSVDPTEIPVGSLEGIAFVFNGNGWDTYEGKAYTENPNTGAATCTDFLFPFPVTGTKKLQQGSLIKQNVPNPFTSSTTIDFTVPKASDVSVKVLNMLGQEVKTLANEKMTAGNHSITWASENVAEGVYFINIVAGNMSDVKKVVKVQ
ncbi:MAG: T9SS type A sorting domain-containing protein [Bacteroidota bacterium]